MKRAIFENSEQRNILFENYCCAFFVCFMFVYSPINPHTASLLIWENLHFQR